MDFYKYQGLGNHFILLDHRASGAGLLSPSLASKLCCSHRGIGADGILSVLVDADGHPRMHIQNADGSDAGMCGNGLRCVARFLHDVGHLSEDATSVKIWVVDHLYDCQFVETGDVCVEMGVALREDKELPSQTANGEELTLEVLGRSFSGSCHFFGNPHYSIFVEESDSPMELAQKFGAALESHPEFPNRVNVSFSKARSDGFETVVYERGVGITQACGSGACAVGASAVLRTRWQANLPMQILLPGGPLTITVFDECRVKMQGEATLVFKGQISIKE